jgi:hypothetical protein
MARKTTTKKTTTTTKPAAKKPAVKKPVAKKAPAKKPAKKPVTKPAKKASKKETTQAAYDAALFPTARAYAEEELHLLSIAQKDPNLGDRFVRDATRRVETAIPKKDRAAFALAMKKVNVEARAKLVVSKMEKYWGVRLDEATKESVKDDVRNMYLGK